MDNRNEKRTASSRRKPANSPPVIVEPEREMPGKMATICTTPTSSAFPGPAVSSDSRPEDSLSDRNRIAPLTSSSTPTAQLTAERLST